MPSDRSSDGTAALDKALDILDAIGSVSAGLSQADLAERLKLPRTTLYRMLGTLVARGLLRRDPMRRVYALGMRCFEYARSAYSMPDLVAAAGAELRALRDMTGETAYIAALDGHEIVVLEICEGAHDQRGRLQPGARAPLHCSGLGKAILAAMPAAQRESLVRDLHLTAHTPQTITDRRRLHAELALTARRGWSIDDEEIKAGMRCAAAPVVDSKGTVRGAISVAGPAFRLSHARIELLGPEIAEAARRIGAQLTAQRPRPAAGDARALPGPWAFNGRHPVWVAEARALFWADTLAPALHRCSEGGTDEIVANFAAPIEAILPQGDQVLVHSGARWWRAGRLGRAPVEVDAGAPQPAAPIALAADGRPWYCLAEGGRFSVGPAGDGGSAPAWQLPEPVTAMAFSADGRLAYLAAEQSGSLLVGQLRPGTPTPLRRLVTVPKASGQLGGIAADQAGGLWCALRGGWSVVRFEADGTLDRVIGLPVPCPTDLAFGGVDGQTLYVTSARDAIGREALDAAPLSGRLFAVAGAGPGVLPPVPASAGSPAPALT